MAARAEDPDGACWIIDTSCLPAGWSFISDSPTCSIRAEACAPTDGGLR
jgi:hypothetical protein